MNPDVDVVGEFEVKGSRLVVSDPCYGRGSIGGILEDVKPGRWLAFVAREDGREGRISDLVIVHESARKDVYDEQDVWEPDDILVGVDSGQAGFFDDAVYPTEDRDKGVGCHGKDQYYEDCCNVTVGDPDDLFPNAKGTDAGVVEGGAVSVSGYGDGEYTLFVREEKGQIVAARIEFIEPEDEEFEEDLEDDDFEEEDEGDEEVVT